MTKRITFILSSAGLATLLLLTLVTLMAALNTTPVRAAPVEAPPAAPSTVSKASLRASPLQQTTTTPTYAISDSVTGGVTYNWVEVSGSGTPVNMAPFTLLSGDNRGSVPINIGFYFPFYENVYQDLRVSTNGYIYFGGTAADGGQTPMFTGSASPPNDFIAPFGANLYMHPDVSRVYIDQQGTQTVIEFVDVLWCCGLNAPHTFEIILYPDGRILTQYRQVRYATNPNERVVAGIENSDGSDGIAYYENWFQEDTSLDDGLAVLYDPGDSIFGHVILDPPNQLWWDDPGQTGSFGVTLFNLTGISDTFDVTYTLSVSSSAVPTSQWPVFVPSTAAVTGTGIISNLGTSTFQVTATIPITADWWDMATLYITASATTSPTISNTVSIDYGVAQRDLIITKTLVPNTPPAPGGYFRYRVAVTNADYPGSNRSGWARNIQVTDTLPLSATLISFAPTAGSAGTLVLPGFLWNVGDVAPNSNESIDVYMQVPESVPTGTILLNTAWTTMTGSIERGPFDNNTVTHTMVVTERRLIFDITKGLLVPGTLVGPGQVVTYTVWVQNDGNVPISDVVVSDVIPLGSTFLTTTWPTSTLLPDNRTVVFTISTLRNGGWNGVGFQVGVSVPVTTPIGTWLTNTVQVTTTAPLTGFAQATGDSDSEVIQVIDPRGDVAVGKSPEMFGSSPVTPEPGGDYTFWISYTNRGNVTVYTVTLTDTLPFSHVVLLEAGPAGTAQPSTTTPGLVVWQIPDLVPGAIGWTRVRILIDENTPPGTQLLNTAEIAAAAGFNITTTNDVSLVTITLDAADVTINKQVTPAGTLGVGDWVTYTVRFTNTGAIAAAGVRITDVLPSELTSVSWITSGHPIEALIDAPPLLVWRATQPLGPGDNGTIVITGQLDPAATWPPQSLSTNRAEIHTATSEEPINDPNTAQVSNVVAYASPYVVKTGPTLALPGELISYSIEYGNGGLLEAQNVRLTDTLPVSTTFVTHTASFTATPASGWITWEVGTIPSNTTGLTFTLVVSVSPGVPPGTPLENTIALASSTYDGDLTDNESTWVTPVGFDLSNSYKQVNGTAGASVGSGTPVTYTIVLTNRGPSSATSVSVWDPIPADTAYVTNSITSSAGADGYDPAGDAITWTGIVSDYTQITITFQVTVADARPLSRDTRITNTAFISDAIQTFQASVPVTITGPNLDGSYKTVNNLRPSTGERITYTIVLNNSGEADALGASLTDTLPSLYVNYTGDGWASSGLLGSGDPVTWTGIITRGERVTLTLPVQVTAGPGNHFANTVQIDDGTRQVIRHSVTVSTTRPVLEAQKIANPSEVASGGRVTYTIAITNTGDGWAQSARVTDTIQSGTVVPGKVTASSGAVDATSPPTITWTGPISPGFSVVITIPVTITATPGSDVPNAAQVSDGYGMVFDAAPTSVHVYSAPNIANSSKVVDQAGARTGDTLVYTLTVVNDGELPTTFFVTDTLDSSTVFTTYVGSPPGSYSDTLGVITWTGTVSGLSQVQLAFQAIVSTSMSGAVTNTARFEAAGDAYTRTAITQILVPAELTATKRVEPAGPVYAGEYLTYTIAMRNVGGDDARAIFTDTIPTRTSYVGGCAVLPAGHIPPLCTQSEVTWEDDIVSGETATLTFQVMVTPGTVTGTVVSNVAWLRELNEAGPLFSVTVTNTALSPVFTATKQAEPAGGVLPGKRITYTLVVTNVNAGVARVVVTDTLPISTTCIPSSIQIFPVYDPPVCTNGTLVWQDDINSSSFARLTYAVAVSQSAPIGTVIANSAQVQELSQPAEVVTVSAVNTVVVPSLSAEKRVQPEGTVVAGDKLTYTIVMSNGGNAPAQVSFSDPIPTHTTYISQSAETSGGGAPPDYDPANDRMTWRGDITPGSIVTLTFAVTVNLNARDGEVITNVAQVEEMSQPGIVSTASVTNPVVAPVVSILKQAEPSGNVLAGTLLSYTIVIMNDGGAPAQIVFSDTLPAYTTFITGSESVLPDTHTPPSYTNGTLVWQDEIDPRQLVAISFVAQVEPGTLGDTTIYNEVWVRELSDPTSVYSDSTTNTVVAPAFSAAKQATPAGSVQPGEVIRYRIVLINPTVGIARAVVTDTIPTHTTYISGSAGIEMSGPLFDVKGVNDLILTPPIYDPLNNRLTWQGDIIAYTTLTLTFGVTVSLDVDAGTVITNVAWVDELSDPAGATSYLVTNPVGGHGIYLPLVLRNY